jgi:hypothetical protein
MHIDAAALASVSSVVGIVVGILLLVLDSQEAKSKVQAHWAHVSGHNGIAAAAWLGAEASPN